MQKFDGNFNGLDTGMTQGEYGYGERIKRFSESVWKFFIVVGFIMLFFDIFLIFVFVAIDKQDIFRNLLLLFNAFIWFILGFITYIRHKLIKSKLSNLKLNGEIYRPNDWKIKFRPGIRYLSYLAVDVQFEMNTEAGSVKAKDGIFFLKPFEHSKENLELIVYYDRVNPKVYLCELYVKRGEQTFE